MFKFIRNISKDEKGFTLTEVMIGMMIMTVAIVATSNLLISLMNSNKSAVNNLKAYYLAQEGVEAVRNIRDTYWLHNEDWLGADNLLGFEFEKSVAGSDNFYAINRNLLNWGQLKASAADRNDLRANSPWKISKETVNDPLDTVYLVESEGPIDFYRQIYFEEYPVADCPADPVECEENFVIVKSKVSWRERGRTQEVELSTLLSNWKGGVL